MKQSIQQAGKGGPKATLGTPLQSSRNPPSGYCCTVSLGVTGTYGKHNPTERTIINLKNILKEY